jgi:hypothetical protein
MKEFIAGLEGAERNAFTALLEGKTISELDADRINEIFNGRFGDLLVEYRDGKPSIMEEYRSILKQW